MGIVNRSSKIIVLKKLNTYKIMAPNDKKAFSSQIKRMSKKPLKYNPEEVMVRKVDMEQDMFNFAMDVAKECMGRFNKEYGEHWMSVVGDDYGVDVSHQGNFAHFHM